MLNQLIIIGRLTKNPEQRKSGETTFANFTLAFDSGVKDESSFIDCVCFNKVAEAVTNFAHKGDLVGIVGSLRQRRYTTKEGQNRSVLEAVVNEIQFLTPKKEEPKEPNPAETMGDPVLEERPPLADGWEYGEDGKARKIKTTAKK